MTVIYAPCGFNNILLHQADETKIENSIFEFISVY